VYQVQVPVRHGIERSGVNGDDLFQEASEGRIWSLDFMLLRTREAIIQCDKNRGPRIALGPRDSELLPPSTCVQPALWA
jgi:hypothetical protein